MPCTGNIKAPDRIIFQYDDGNEEVWMFIDPKVMDNAGNTLNALFFNQKGKDLLNVQCQEKNPSDGDIEGIVVVRVPKVAGAAPVDRTRQPPAGCCYINNEVICW